MIVPVEGSRSTARDGRSRSHFLVHVNLLARCSRQDAGMLTEAYDAAADVLQHPCRTCDKRTFKRFIARWAHQVGSLFAKRIRGPSSAALSLRYTHRVAISNRRLIAADDGAIAFRWKDYRVNARVVGRHAASPESS